MLQGLGRWEYNLTFLGFNVSVIQTHSINGLTLVNLDNLANFLLLYEEWFEYCIIAHSSALTTNTDSSWSFNCFTTVSASREPSSLCYRALSVSIWSSQKILILMKFLFLFFLYFFFIFVLLGCGKTMILVYRG